MNVVAENEARGKLHRIREFLAREGAGALVLARRDNFAWLTGGGDNAVVRDSELGFSILIVLPDRVVMIAHVMDGQRILDEEMRGLDVEPVFIRWYEGSLQERASRFIAGRAAISDAPMEGTRCAPVDITALHYPLTEREMEQCRKIGAKTEQIIAGVAAEVRPGMTERKVAAMLLSEYAGMDMSCDVLLVAGDERIAKYRHPLPTDKVVERTLLIHPAVRWGGLHANVTRMIHFGAAVPDGTARSHEAASRIEAAAISMCRPGQRFSQILVAQKELYASTGFADEWRNHFQGGITGYVLADATRCLDESACVSQNQAFDWFITITGAKVEELCLTGSSGPEVPSVAGGWPVRRYDHGGFSVDLPQILLR
jgi:Xaa-Pro aminopeptidase